MKNFKTNEIEMKITKDHKPQKENDVALKASLRELKKKSVATPTTSEDDEELTLLVKNMNMYIKKERRSDLRRKSKKKIMKATTWNSDSESDHNFVHMCFMVQGDDLLEVNS